LAGENKSLKSRLWLWLAALILAPAIWILAIFLEGEAPNAVLELTSGGIGRSGELSVSASDEKRGLSRISIDLLKDGKETILFEKNFASSGWFSGGTDHETSFKVTVEPGKLGISDGKALIRLSVRDYSWRKWLKGNLTYLEKEVMIDTQPPKIDVLSRVHNLGQGGSGLAIYRVSESGTTSGVQVGGNFFPGYGGYFKDPDICMALFALAYDQGPGTTIHVSARDAAGNSTIAGFPYHIRKVRYPEDSINISDQFLNWKLPEFAGQIPSDAPQSPVDRFLWVNRELRKQSIEKIRETTRQTDKDIYWKGAFLRLPSSATRAAFGDRRKYQYEGRMIDEQVHMGIDLASLAQSPVPASGSGKVVFTDNIGIFGRTVVVDHGFGLFTTYSHLSAVDVQPGQMVARGENLGRTGTTGMAGGDHLHYGAMVHGVFVNPLEWWDASWIENNILSKIESVKSGLN